MLAQGASPGWQGIKTASAVGAALLEFLSVCMDVNRAEPSHKQLPGGYGFSRAEKLRKLRGFNP